MAFHLIYTQSLCDDTDLERSMGITRSFDWHSHASKKLFYIDRGFSNGMMLGYLDAVKKDIDVEFRSLSIERPILDLVKSLNAGIQSDKELAALSKLLKEMAQSNARLDIGMPGDVTDFRQYHRSDLDEIKRLNLIEASEHISFERLAMRQSLVDKGESPLCIDLLYRQFVDIGLSQMVDDWSLPWVQAAEDIVLYQNPADKALESEARQISFNDSKSALAFIEALNDDSYSSREREFDAELS